MNDGSRSDRTDGPIAIRPLVRSDMEALTDLFESIAQDPAASRFHPHPFTRIEAIRVATHDGKDRYLGLFIHGSLAGYGMLRGRDEGFATPSLGIYLVPAARNRGLSRVFMDELHRVAAADGANRVRLKVYADNAGAVRLYRGLGYRFTGEEAGQMIGLLDLPAPFPARHPSD